MDNIVFVCRSFVLIHFQRHHLSATQIEVIRTVFLLPYCPFNCDSMNCLQYVVTGSLGGCVS